MPPPSINWTPDRVEELKRHWDTGASGGKIAAAMNVTRNAIIGKAHRLGLVKRGVVIGNEERLRRERKRQQRNASRILRQRNTRNQFREEKPMQELPPVPEPFAGSLDIPFNELRIYSSSTPNECRFIEAEPARADSPACGHETLKGESYCGHHRGIVYGRPAIISDEERERRHGRGVTNGRGFGFTASKKYNEHPAVSDEAA